MIIQAMRLAYYEYVSKAPRKNNPIVVSNYEPTVWLIIMVPLAQIIIVGRVTVG